MEEERESEFVREFRERQEAFDRTWKKVDETGLGASRVGKLDAPREAAVAAPLRGALPAGGGPAGRALAERGIAF